MTGLRELSRKLRRAADVIDELLIDAPATGKSNQTKATATKLLKGMKKRTHWTQTPKGRKLLAARREERSRTHREAAHALKMAK